MEKRRIGNIGLEIAPLALGGNVFDWTADEATSFAVLDAFVDAGGTMVDTADVYSAWVPGHKGGESESVIGRWLKRSGKRDQVVIATKVGMMAGLAPATIAAACDASLQRLGVDRIDLYYQHKDDEGVPLADSLGEFDALKRAGKIGAIGLSNFTAPRVEEALAVSARSGFAHPVALQNWYNLVEREKFEGPLRDVALREGLAAFARGTISPKALAGCATPNISKAAACAFWRRWTKSRQRPASRSPRSRWPGRWPSRASPRLSPVRRASSNCGSWSHR